MPVMGGTVYVTTPAGHRLVHAGKGKRRQLVCERCKGRLFVGGNLNVTDAVESLLVLVQAHGGEVCP